METNGASKGRAGTKGSPPVDRLPPHAMEAEQGVLGCILLDPRTALAECQTRFGAAEVFYDLRHQRIYAALSAMAERNEAIDIITLQNCLRDRQELEQVGGLAYLASLPDLVPSAANLAEYAELVWEKYLLRRMVTVCTAAVRRVYECQGNVQAVLDEVEAEVLAVNGIRAGAGEALPMRDAMAQASELVEKMHRGVGIIGGIRTHFGYFDKMTGGLHRKEMAVLAARPSLGKTSWMLNIAVNVAKHEKVPVLVNTLEMGLVDLTLRAWCAEAGVNFHKLRTGFPSREDMDALARKHAKVSLLPIYLDETPALGILEFRARARRAVQRYGVGLIMVDYMQLMHGRAGRDYGGNRAQEVADISGGLKASAKELNVALLVVSQLNRESARNKNRKPQLEDLRESGAIEQDADLVALLYRPKNEEDDDNEGALVIPVNAHIAKQRNGPTGPCEMMFHRSLMKMEDAYGNRGREVEEPAPRQMPSSSELGLGK